MFNLSETIGDGLISILSNANKQKDESLKTKETEEQREDLCANRNSSDSVSIEQGAESIRHISEGVSIHTDSNGETTFCVEIDLDKEGLRYDQVMARHAAQQEQQIDNEAAAVIDERSSVIDETTMLFPYQEYLATGLSLMDEPAKSKNFFRTVVGKYRDKAQMHWADWVEDKVPAVKAMEEVQAIRDELQAFQKEAEAMKIDTKIWRTELDFRFIDDVLSALRQGSKKFVNTQANAAKNPAMAEAMRRAGVKKD